MAWLKVQYAELPLVSRNLIFFALALALLGDWKTAGTMLLLAVIFVVISL